MQIHRGNIETTLNFLNSNRLLSKKDQILEIGSGTGYLVHYVSKAGFQITGTEINQNYIDFAVKEYSIKLKKIMSSQLNFKNNTYTKVLSFDVLEHIPDTNKHLTEVYRILKPGGSYLFSTPNKLTNLPFEIIKEKSLTKYKRYHPSLHYFWQLKSKLISHGFQPTFYDVPVVNKYFKQKLVKYLGKSSLHLLRVLNPDKLPIALRTNFYVQAKKDKQ